CNYNADAGCNDGSCTYPGCTDESACNYNPAAGCSNGSCVYPGCTIPTACNYNPAAGCNDGSCQFPGCTDEEACNYNADAGCDDDSCTYPGCTDPLALNYNPNAGCDDESCQYDETQCFFICPDDAWVECGTSTSPEATGSAYYTGACGVTFVNYTDGEVSGDNCHSWFVRHWCGQEYIIGGAGDNGNCSHECDQVIHIVDTTAPEFVETPADITVSCIDDVPAPAECVATDNCTENISYDVFSSTTGECLEQCTLSVAYGPGPDWSVWLPELAIDGLAASANWVWSSGAYLTSFADGTAHLWGDVVNASNPAQGFHVNMWFENAADWSTWSSMGRSYKDDLNLATPGALYEDWTYYELVNGFSTLTGFGDYAGSSLYLSHFPYDYYYGFQCGEAANNKNANQGMSGWFVYDGWLNGEMVWGNGDLNVDKSCTPCLPLECPESDNQVTYFWRAEDECGNVAFTSQVISIVDEVAPWFINCPENVQVDCYEEALAIVVPTAAELIGYDNCDEGVLTTVYAGAETEGDECTGSTTHTYYIEDCSGNRTYCTFVISWNDEEAPALEGQSMVYVECGDDIPSVPPTVWDNCDD
ncbi:MAG: hypothetical protein JNM00_00275, partial [Flavobacteriales bacterium]|nr:hypothetical protein [Flavobacteriales bacterium]